MKCATGNDTAAIGAGNRDDRYAGTPDTQRRRLLSDLAALGAGARSFPAAH
jgi:hypothetical protein